MLPFIAIFCVLSFAAGARTVADHPEMAKVFKKPAPGANVEPKPVLEHDSD